MADSSALESERRLSVTWHTAPAREDASRRIALEDGDWFLTVYQSPWEIVIVGAVHIAQALVTLAMAAGFKVRVIDPRESYATQERFPGIGNWMADEILWRAKIAPSTRAAVLTPKQRLALRRATRFVSREALRIIGHDNSDPPASWLIHQRWKANGVCP